MIPYILNLSNEMHNKDFLLRGGLKRAFLMMGFFWTLFTATAQQYSVTGNLIIAPPVPLTLGEFAAPSAGTSSLFTLNLNWVNMEATAVPIKLKMYLERGNTLIATSTEDFQQHTFSSNALELKNQLKDYFQFLNLQGISQSQYDRRLDEGLYRISFVVYSVSNNEQLSATISQNFFITLNPNPALSQPANAEQIPNSTNNIIFQWRAQSPAVGAFATPPQYKLTLVDVPTGTTDVAALFNAPSPKYSSANQPYSTSSLPVTAATLGLVAGNTYAWRVQVVQAINQTNVPHPAFKNDGYSDIFTFKYASSTDITCPAPTNLVLTAKASDVIAVSWTPSTEHFASRVAYRKYSTTDVWQWVEVPTDNASLYLTGLESTELAGIEYEVRVGGVCGEDKVSYCPPLRVFTLPKGQIQCGTPVISAPVGTGIAALYTGDVIKAGDFDVTLIQITGSNGNFSGEGWIKVPWILDTRIKVKFTGIGVNTEKKMTTGIIETAYDPNWGNIIGGSNSSTTSINDLVNIINNLTDKLNELSRLMQSGSQEAITAWLNANRNYLTAYFDQLFARVNISDAEKDRIRGILNSILNGQGNATTIQNLLNELNIFALEAAAAVAAIPPIEIEVTTPNGNIAPPPAPRPSARLANSDIWITPTGEPIKLPTTAKPIDFLFCSQGVEWTLPNGILKGFKMPDNKRYCAKIAIVGSQQIFYGYYDYDRWIADNQHRTLPDTRFSQTDNFTFPEKKTVANVVRYTRDLPTGKIVSSAISLANVVFNTLENVDKVNGAGKVCLSVTSISEEEDVSTTQINQSCDNGTGILADYIKGNKLQKWLGDKGKNKGVLLFSDCSANSEKILYKVNSEGTQKITTDAESNTLKASFESGNFEAGGGLDIVNGAKEYVLKICIGKDGKWDFKFKFKTGKLIPNPKLTGLHGITTAQAEAAINATVKRIQDASNKSDGKVPNYGIKEDATDAENKNMGEIYAENAGLVEVITEVVETGQTIVNEAKMPEKYWKKDDSKYGKSMIHLPAVLGGVGDGAIDEVTEKIQFVQFGLSLVENPSQIKEAWNSGADAIKNFKFSEVAEGLQTQLTVLITEDTDDAWHTRGQKTVELALGGGSIIKGFAAAGGMIKSVKKKFSLSALLNRTKLRKNIIGTLENKSVAEDYFRNYKVSGQIPQNTEFNHWYETEFKKEVSKPAVAPFQSHHLIPENIVKDNADFKKFLEWEHTNNKNWNYAGEDNGLMLSTRNKNVNPEPFAGNHGNHPNYDDQVELRVKAITDNHLFGKNLPSDADFEAVLTEIKIMNAKIKVQLREKVINGENIVNNIILNLN